MTQLPAGRGRSTGGSGAGVGGASSVVCQVGRRGMDKDTATLAAILAIYLFGAVMVHEIVAASDRQERSGGTGSGSGGARRSVCQAGGSGGVNEDEDVVTVLLAVAYMMVVFIGTFSLNFDYAFHASMPKVDEQLAAEIRQLGNEWRAELAEIEADI
ncbi:hypothetical protein ABPG75_013919 [Micractinium tetrahymenae]